MSEVKRYDPMGYDRLSGYMQQHPEGDYVRHADYAALEAECDTLRQQRDKLARVLESVEREHELIRQMKNCEIRRGRGSFGIAVMSDTLAIEWQAFDKELQQLIDVRHAALAAELAAIKGQELRADPVKAQLLEALEASNTLLRIKRHACGNTEVCRVLDTHITRNSAAIAAARKEGGE